MVIITRKETDSIIDIGNELQYLENGYPLLVDRQVYFSIDDVNVYEVDSVPEEVTPSKYCYTEERAFYLNPNYIEPNPYGISDELVEQIEADYRERLAKEVAEYGYDA